MQIEILKVDVAQKTNKSGKPYSIAEVAYKNNDSGKVEGKKILEFTNKEVWAVISAAKSGERLDVTSEKNDQSGYWEWVKVVPAGSGAAPAAKSSPSPKSTYETPEERALKQVYIVRQSSVSSAINLLKTDKVIPKLEEVLETAAAIEQYVFGTKPDSVVKGSFDDFNDDVPL